MIQPPTADFDTSPLEACVPLELRNLRQWVAWKLEPPFKEGDKWRKVPYSPVTHRRASTTAPVDWGTFREALGFARAQGMSGVGFVFTEGDPYAGVDLDDCRDPHTGEVASWALEIVAALNSYTEVSTSGKGLHIIVRAKLPPEGRKSGRIEMYEAGRYFCVTGAPLPGLPKTAQHRQAEVETLHRATFNRPEAQSSDEPRVISLSRDDAQILELARRARNGAKFQVLYSGEWEQLGYKSQSEADLALCGQLKFWTQDRAQLDRLFRGSGLYRHKWDERRGDQTYGELTVQLALDGGGEVYSGPAEPVRAGQSVGECSAEADSDDDLELPEDPWPDPPAACAYYGLAGDLVRLVEPQTEADPVAILAQMLVAFGNLVGRGPHFVAEASRHYPNLFCVLVGATAKGRKGSAWNQVARIVETVDDEWARTRRLSGLSSGEGLIWEVRDPIKKRELKREKGKAPEYVDVVADEGVSDKRLLVFEGEFASALKAMTRQGNTLSTTIRQAWDDGCLNTIVKNFPARASDAHISIVGHITRDELLRDMQATETSNGFANRFLWVCVRRSKLLPEGDGTDRLDFGPLAARFAEVADFAARVPQMRRDEEARELWHAVYADLSEGRPGLFGLVTSRAEAQVMRLACLYALLDRSVVIRRLHLEAALALWRYCEASCRWIFGDRLGDPTADEILRALRERPEGMTRTEMMDLFARHKTKEEIKRALGILYRNGLAKRSRVQTGGRPAEIWQAAAK